MKLIASARCASGCQYPSHRHLEEGRGRGDNFGFFLGGTALTSIIQRSLSEVLISLQIAPWRTRGIYPASGNRPTSTTFRIHVLAGDTIRVQMIRNVKSCWVFTFRYLENYFNQSNLATRMGHFAQGHFNMLHSLEAKTLILCFRNGCLISWATSVVNIIDKVVSVSYSIPCLIIKLCFLNKCGTDHITILVITTRTDQATL